MPREIKGGQSKLSAALHKAHARGEHPAQLQAQGADLAATLPQVAEETSAAIDLSSFTYRELQTLANDHDLRASGARDILEARLIEHFEGA
jgi:hypothetical protein